MTNQGFFSGFMNTDDPVESIPQGNHVYAKNGEFEGHGSNKRFQSFRSFSELDLDLPGGNNRAMFSFFHKEKESLYTFLYNSAGDHGIYVTQKTGESVWLLRNDFNGSVLNFSDENPVTSASLIPGEDGNDILMWCSRNDRPMRLPIVDALSNTYGNSWIPEYVTLARVMPLKAPICSYNSEPGRISNLRSKLYQFRYRWRFKSGETSTWSPYSKLFAPDNPDDLSDDADMSKNNRIDIVFEAGPIDAVGVEIASRFIIGAAFSDIVLVADLDKDDLDIQGGVATYKYFGNYAAIPLDQIDSDLLFDMVPYRANSMDLIDTNTPILAGLVEGVTMECDLDVSIDATLVDNESGGGPLTVSYSLDEELRRNCVLRFYGTPQPGDLIYILIRFVATDPMFEPDEFIIFFTYTVQAGDTLFDVTQNIYQEIVANRYDDGVRGTAYNQLQIDLFGYGQIELSYRNEALVPDEVEFYVENAGAPPGSQTSVGISVMKPRSEFGYGIVYFDKFGVTDGVKTSEAMAITTLEQDTTGLSKPKVTSIVLSISHRPPVEAISYSIVRTVNLTYQRWIQVVTNDTSYDEGTETATLSITSHQLNKFNYPLYDFSRGDRVRVIGVYNPVGSVRPATQMDYPVVSVDTQDGLYLVKIPYDSSWMSAFVPGTKYLIELYTPAKRATKEDLLYYEIGENYSILSPGAENRRHVGSVQNQSSDLSEPAKVAISFGDCYLRKRSVSLIPDGDRDTDPLPGPFESTIFVFDESVSDKYDSKSDGRGRAFVVDKYAGRRKNLSAVRYGRPYIQGTLINDSNRFLVQNFEEYDRNRGPIEAIKVRGSTMRVFQSSACATVPIYSSVIEGFDGQSQLIQSDKAINSIRYLSTEYSIGDQFMSLCSSATEDFFVDPNNGTQVAWSDRVQPLMLAKAEFRIREEILELGQGPKISGVTSRLYQSYDYGRSTLRMYSRGGDYDGKTIAPYHLEFSFKDSGYVCYWDFVPDTMVSLNSVLYAWKDGIPWRQVSAGFGEVFGQRLAPTVSVPFNNSPSLEKKFMSLSYQGSEGWSCPEIETSTLNIWTAIRQKSNLIEADFKQKEGGLYSSQFLRDQNSPGGIVEGDSLAGFWAVVRFSYSGSDYGWLSMPYCTFVENRKNF